MLASDLQTSYRDWLDLADSEGTNAVLDSWGFVPYIERGELAAIAMVKGTEIHLAIAPSWRLRLLSRRRVRQFLAPLMERYGFLTTRSLEGDVDSAIFLLRLGFVKTWTELQIHHWMLTALPFGKGV